VLLTNDDTLSPEDVGLGYKAMMIIGNYPAPVFVNSQTDKANQLW
jgi:hypothetical protein